MTTLRASVRIGVPFLVSGAILAALFWRIDLGGALDRITLGAALLLVPALLAYGALSLAIEARSLLRLVPPGRGGLDAWSWARLKAATYPLYLLHYALGGTVFGVLVGRRTRIGLADAAGVVVLLALFDLAVLLLVTTAGAALLATQAPAVRATVIATATAGLVGGLAILRAPGSLGPLERLRSLPLFRTARTASTTVLLEVGLLRLIFVLTFIGLAWSALTAFEITVPPGDMVVGVAGVALIATLPIAVSGIGTGQVAFVYLFRHWGDPETLLACSLTLTAGMILLRAGLGLVFARELTREAFAASREVGA